MGVAVPVKHKLVVGICGGVELGSKKLKTGFQSAIHVHGLRSRWFQARLSPETVEKTDGWEEDHGFDFSRCLFA